MQKKSNERGMTEHDPLRELLIVALVSRKSDERMVKWYADRIGGRHHFRIRVLREDAQSANGEAMRTMRELAETGSLGFLVAPLPADVSALKRLFEFVTEIDVPALFVRQAPERRIRRILVASAGAPHTLQQLWVAREIGITLNIPVHAVRLVDADEEADILSSAARNGDALMESWTPRILGMTGEDHRLVSADFAQGIVDCIRPGDLLAMGAPSSLYVDRLEDSIPALVAHRTNAPLIVMKSKRAERVTLRSLFWGHLIMPHLHAADKEAVITELVEALVQHNQAPRSYKASLVNRAMRRERLASTAVGCETAFPHVRLPGFHCVAGSMAICPEGVDFGGENGARTKFIYLLISSDGFCDEHLAVMARIARRMVREEVRDALLGCATASEILDVLEPRMVGLPAEVAVGVPDRSCSYAVPENGRYTD